MDPVQATMLYTNSLILLTATSAAAYVLFVRKFQLDMSAYVTLSLYFLAIIVRFAS